MKIRKILRIVNLLAAVSAMTAAVAAADTTRPNILFVFTDDHAPHAIGAYNGFLKSVNPTPNNEALDYALRGVPANGDGSPFSGIWGTVQSIRADKFAATAAHSAGFQPCATAST